AGTVKSAPQYGQLTFRPAMVSGTLKTRPQAVQGTLRSGGGGGGGIMVKIPRGRERIGEILPVPPVAVKENAGKTARRFTALWVAGVAGGTSRKPSPGPSRGPRPRRRLPPGAPAGGP